MASIGCERVSGYPGRDRAGESRNEELAVSSNPYWIALDLVKAHSGTSGQGALAECILSLYNPVLPFSIGKILAPLDERYTEVVLGNGTEYFKRGETEELRMAGQWV